jgi:LacI family transcriptional regulator
LRAIQKPINRFFDSCKPINRYNPMPDVSEEPDLAKGKIAGTRVSMQNVAAYAGVSIATVSKVMQGVPTVLPENVTKVQNAIEALGYRINPLGAELRRGRRNLIGAIVPTLEEPAIARLLTALETEIEARAHVLFVASSHRSEPRETDLVGRMIDWRVAGLIMVPIKGQRSGGALLLEDAGLPTVFVQREAGVRHFDTISAGRGRGLAGADPGEVAALPTDVLAATSAKALFRRIDSPDPPLVLERVQPAPNGNRVSIGTSDPTASD